RKARNKLTVERTQLPELAFTRSTRSEEQGLCPSTNNHTFYVWMVFCALELLFQQPEEQNSCVFVKFTKKKV
ncbi:MAG: hypothetical protein IIZ76_04945, partial [Clostridia bacterium]|nr:hypothetical protein [Clostridia bacterium]